MLFAIDCVLCSYFLVLVFALVRSSVFVFVSIVLVVWLLFVFFVLHLILWTKTRSRTKNKEQQQHNDNKRNQAKAPITNNKTKEHYQTQKHHFWKQNKNTMHEQ